MKRLFLEDEPVYTPKDLAASRQGFEARGGLSGDKIQIPRDRGFADSLRWRGMDSNLRFRDALAPPTAWQWCDVA